LLTVKRTSGALAMDAMDRPRQQGGREGRERALGIQVGARLLCSSRLAGGGCVAALAAGPTCGQPRRQARYLVVQVLEGVLLRHHLRHGSGALVSAPPPPPQRPSRDNLPVA
jgi:hypothetical protein